MATELKELEPITDTDALRDELRQLVDALLDEDLPTVTRMLKGLIALEDEAPSYTFENAPEVEPLPDELELLEDARVREIRGEVKYISHEEARRLLLGEKT
ncbi:MAG: hypothetical protein O3A46_01050 [Candidatus Poribacteria bacterium]|nr:hypothetical protein [Candidatus Poribacteria bacterium]